MNLPKYKIFLDKKLDEECFITFLKEGNEAINNFFPEIKNEQGIHDLLDPTYINAVERLNKVVEFLKNNKETLNKFAEELAEKFDCTWEGIEKVIIIPAVCPVCPRFIKENKFMVCYFFSSESILRICAHEMTHFLYFKKVREILRADKVETENPSNEWLLSEIIATEVINSPRFQNIISDKESLSVPKELKLKTEIIKKVINNFRKKNFREFYEDSILYLDRERPPK